MLRLWYLVFGILLQLMSASPSPLDFKKSVRINEEVENSESFKRFEHVFLKSLGVKMRPRLKRGIRAPQYMKDLYHSDQKHPEWISTNFRFNGKWTSVNTVRAFYPEDDHPARQGRADLGQSIIKFDLASFPKHEDVHSVELRLFKRRSWRKANDTKARIQLYQIVSPSNKQSIGQYKRLIESKLVNLTESEWESFDISSLVKHWIQNPANNHGIQVYIASTDSSSEENFSYEAKEHTEKPFLVAFCHDSRTHHHQRRKRSILATTNSWIPERPTSEQCRKHPLFVDFHALGFSDWILAPRGYSAYDCGGSCQSDCIPKNRTCDNATNHDKLVHYTKVIKSGSYLDLDLVSKLPLAQTCCVPKQLSPLALLYIDGTRNVVLKHYPNMVVEKCGCINVNDMKTV